MFGLQAVGYSRGLSMEEMKRLTPRFLIYYELSLSLKVFIFAVSIYVVNINLRFY